MNTDYTAYRSHQLREADLVRRLELQRQALEHLPAPRRRGTVLRVFRRTQLVRAS